MKKASMQYVAFKESNSNPPTLLAGNDSMRIYCSVNIVLSFFSATMEILS